MARNVVNIEVEQNIFDVAVQQFGSIEGVADVVKNNDLSFSSIVAPGTELNANGVVRDRNITAYFKPRRKPATGSEELVNNKPVNEGIDFWAIGLDFVVQ